MARRRKTRKIEWKWLAFFPVLTLLVLLSKCGHSEKPTPTPQNVETMVSILINETPPPEVTEMSYLDAYHATRDAHRIEARETLERERIEATMTWAVIYTQMPTSQYLATFDKFSTQAVQHATMVVLMTEDANK